MRSTLLLALLLAALAVSGGARAQANLEYKVKAAYVYKFAGYVQWPDAESSADRTPLIIGVNGADALSSELRALTSGREVGGRSIEIRAINSTADLNGVQVLFVGRKSDVDWESWLAANRSLPVLTISESPGALSDGSMINFVTVDRRVRFEVDLANAERAGLKVGARLLSAAIAVQKE